MSAENILDRIKDDLLGWMAAHPLIVIGIIVGGVLMLTGMGQTERGKTYLDEDRAKRGEKKMMAGFVVLLFSVWITGILDPMINSLVTFWTK